jgi:hypothetical protein
MLILKRTWAWSADPYDKNLPPPLCFTAPAGQRFPQGRVVAGGGLGVKFRKPKLMMDPTDRSTWQRPYRFT